MVQLILMLCITFLEYQLITLNPRLLIPSLAANEKAQFAEISIAVDWKQANDYPAPSLTCNSRPLRRPLLTPREAAMDNGSAENDAWGTSFSADAAAYGNGTSSPVATLASNGHNAAFNSGEFAHQAISDTWCLPWYGTQLTLYQCVPPSPHITFINRTPVLKFRLFIICRDMIH